MSTTPLYLLLLLSLLVPACGTDRGKDNVTRETLSSGLTRTTWHHLPEIRLSLDTLAVWDVWDVRDEDEGYIFGDIKTACGSPEGFYLVDAVTRQIVLVDLQGNVRQAFGHQGSGPGEFQYPMQIFTRDDEIWVGDIVSRQYSVFDRKGSFLRIHPWSGRGRGTSDGFVITPADAELCATRTSNGFRALLSFPLDGNAADTIAVMHTHPASGATLNIPGLGPTTMYDPPAYSQELLWAWGPNGRILTVTSIEYRIEQRDLSGRILQELVTPTPDLTLTAADREAYLTRLAQTYGGDVEDYRRSNPRFESQYPFVERRAAIESIKIDPLSRIWVLANTLGNTRQRLDLFDQDFTYLGSLTDLPLPEAWMLDGKALFRIADVDAGADLFFVAQVVSASG